MIRKTIFAIAAVAAVGAAVLAPTAAFAGKGKHHHHGHGFGGGVFIATVVDSDCGWQWVQNRRGYLVKVWSCD